MSQTKLIERQLKPTLAAVNCTSWRKRGRTEEIFYGKREFHLLLAIFVGGSLLGGIIYCFQTPTGFITYSSYYLAPLWSTHKDFFCWQNTGRGWKSEGGKNVGREKAGRRLNRGENRERDKGCDSRHSETSGKGLGFYCHSYIEIFILCHKPSCVLCFSSHLSKTEYDEGGTVRKGSGKVWKRGGAGRKITTLFYFEMLYAPLCQNRTYQRCNIPLVLHVSCHNVRAAILSILSMLLLYIICLFSFREKLWSSDH